MPVNILKMVSSKSWAIVVLPILLFSFNTSCGDDDFVAEDRLSIFNDTESPVVIRRTDVDTGQQRLLAPGETLNARDRATRHDPVLGNFSSLSGWRNNTQRPDTEIGVFSEAGELQARFALPVSSGVGHARVCVTQASEPPFRISRTMTLASSCPPVTPPPDREYTSSQVIAMNLGGDESLPLFCVIRTGGRTSIPSYGFIELIDCRIVREGIAGYTPRERPVEHYPTPQRLGPTQFQGTDGRNLVTLVSEQGTPFVFSLPARQYVE